MQRPNTTRLKPCAVMMDLVFLVDARRYSQSLSRTLPFSFYITRDALPNAASKERGKTSPDCFESPERNADDALHFLFLPLNSPPLPSTRAAKTSRDPFTGDLWIRFNREQGGKTTTQGKRKTHESIHQIRRPAGPSSSSSLAS